MEDGTSLGDAEGSATQVSRGAVALQDAHALAGAYYSANYGRLARLVGSRYPSLDPEDVVQDLFNKILDDLESCSSAELPDRVERWTSNAFVSRALLNAALDLVRGRVRTREDVTDLTAVNLSADGGAEGDPDEDVRAGSGPSTPEAVAAHLAALTRRAAARSMLQVLYERGQRPRKRQPYLTERHRHLLLALHDPDPSGHDDVAASDDELASDALHRDKLARARWVAQHGYSDVGHGSQTSAAVQLGVSRQAVSKGRTAIDAAVVLVHYVAGVLAPEKALLDPEAVHRHVDAYESLDDRSGQPGHARRLEAAAPAVRSSRTSGTRVQPHLLSPPPAVPLQQAVTELHGSEQRLADLTRTASPNCVTSCGLHTRRRDRITEVHF